jgi:hypothetical protein
MTHHACRVAVLFGCGLAAAGAQASGGAPAGELPGRYFKLLEAELAPLTRRLAAEPDLDLKKLEAQPEQRHFPGTILAAAVLYARKHPANPSFGDKTKLALALQIGDLLARENEQGNFQKRLDHDWDTAMWLEAYRLLEKELGGPRQARWRKELEKNVKDIYADAAPREDFPRYQGPYIRTSTNHYALWASTVYLAGRTFGNKTWEEFGARVMHRLATAEQTADGYWGEYTDNGPATGYNSLTMTGVALYWEHSGDQAALQALRRATDFHKYFTWPDGTPVEVINGRNRHWGVITWGHFGFSHFPDGRRYAEFLTRLLPEGKIGYHALGRLAQSAWYYHEGPTAPIPQDLPRFVHRMKVPAGIRKTAPWTVCLSGLMDQPSPSQFTLDRQGHVSIFHDKLGLIVSGANSRNQPELATLVEKTKGQVTHLPVSSQLRLSEGDDGDRLALAYQTFFAEFTVLPAKANQLQLRLVVTETGKNRLDEAELHLQLVLRAGAVLETAKTKINLSDQRIELGTDEIGGWIRHRGWTLKVDTPARLVWPVFPFNPYSNGPETDLRHAVGVLTVPIHVKAPAKGTLPWRRQEIAFSLEAANP